MSRPDSVLSAAAGGGAAGGDGVLVDAPAVALEEAKTEEELLQLDVDILREQLKELNVSGLDGLDKKQLAALLSNVKTQVADEADAEGSDDGIDESRMAEQGKMDIAAVTIPRFDTKSSGGKRYTAYQVAIRMCSGLEWAVERRYTQFYVLHKQLKAEFPVVRRLKFPRKKLFRSLASSTVQERRIIFQGYITALLALRPRPMHLNYFLEIPSHVEAGGGGDGKGGGEDSKLSVDDFELLKVLGKGSFGKVYLVRKVSDQKIYAMKVLKKAEVARRKQVEHTRTERRIMEDAVHPFICNLHFAFQSEDKLYMITDYCPGGELFFHLKKLHAFSESMVRFYSCEIILGLSHLHAHQIVYRDLKPENVLLDAEGHIRLTDFGLSRDNLEHENAATTFCGTPEYLSPEMIMHRKTRAGYGVSVDWWSLGTLIYEMYTGWPPFYDKNIRKMCDNILRKPLDFPAKAKFSAEAQSLIGGFLERDPAKRLGVDGGMERLQGHEFFAKLDWAQALRRELDPPFKPKVNSDTDIRNFDITFTKMPTDNSPPEGGSPAAAAADQTAQQAFPDFTFRHPAEALAGGKEDD